jgi:hypothetical protein
MSYELAASGSFCWINLTMVCEVNIITTSQPYLSKAVCVRNWLLERRGRSNQLHRWVSSCGACHWLCPRLKFCCPRTQLAFRHRTPVFGPTIRHFLAVSKEEHGLLMLVTTQYGSTWPRKRPRRYQQVSFYVTVMLLSLETSYTVWVLYRLLVRTHDTPSVL